MLIELNNNEINHEMHDDSDDMTNKEASQDKKLTSAMCDKAFKLTDSIPYHEIIQTMIMIKTKHSRTYLMSLRPY